MTSVKISTFDKNVLKCNFSKFTMFIPIKSVFGHFYDFLLAVTVVKKCLNTFKSYFYNTARNLLPVMTFIMTPVKVLTCLQLAKTCQTFSVAFLQQNKVKILSKVCFCLRCFSKLFLTPTKRHSCFYENCQNSLYCFLLKFTCQNVVLSSFMKCTRNLQNCKKK